MAILVNEIDADYFEDIRSIFFRDNVKSVKQDTFSVRKVETDFGYIQTKADDWHLLYLPSKKCFKFDQHIILISMFCDNNRFIVYQDEIIGYSNLPVMYSGTDLGIVNTGSYSLNLVGTWKT